MATGSDQVSGYAMVTLAATIFTYYTIWVVILPFVEPGHTVHSYFLPRVYAMLIPIVAGVIVLLGLGVFIAVIIAKNKKSKPKKS